MKNISNILLGILKFFAVLICIALALFVIYYGVDFLLKDLSSAVVRAVISNFIVFATIIIFVSQKAVKPSKLLADAQQAVNDNIMASETVKADSETRLAQAEESIANIDNEINSLFEKTEANAELVGAKIIADAENTVTIVKANTEKAIENSQNLLKNELLRRASLASVEVARAHIINELNNNQGLHDKLIDESVEAIEGVELA